MDDRDPKENIITFLGEENPLSNWHPCRFTVKGVAFNCVEQFMMYCKAKLFNDEESANKILLAEHPREQKKLGRRVRGFIEEVWKEHCYNYVYIGCREKFKQNEHLAQYLLNTGLKVLVEANARDTVWGIGYYSHDARAYNPALWQGQNLLGVVLMEVRNYLSVRNYNHG